MARTANPTVPLLHALLAQGQQHFLTYESLARVAEISPRSVASKVSQLREVQAVVGRRPVILGPGLGLALAISCTDETIRAGLVDANGALLHAVEEPELDLMRQPPRLLLRRLRAVGTQVLETALTDPGLCPEDDSSLRLLGIVIAWPSPVDHLGRATGRRLAHPNWMLPDEGGHVSLAERVSAEFGEPFVRGRSQVLSDIHARALCVAFDDARSQALDPKPKEQKLAMVVQVDERVSAAILALPPSNPQRLSFIDTRLIGGVSGLAGEIGHLPVSEGLIADCNRRSSFPRLAPLDYEEAVCSCGIRGHLEAFVSSKAVATRLKASGYRPLVEDRGIGGAISSPLDEHLDRTQLQAIRDAGRILGAALAGSVAMLDPDRITLTGSLASRHLVEGLLHERDRWSEAAVRAPITFVDGPQRAFTAVRGAGLSLLRQSVYRQFEQGVDQIRLGSFDFGPADLSILREKAL
jgi:predicted NBD/HSP70 family sugar kinase